jgi:hypothetical protein
MVKPMRHARFASLPERIPSTYVETSRSPVWIDVRWTIRGQSDPERDNYLSGMIPSAWDAGAGLRLMQSGARGDGCRIPATIPA